MARSLPIFLLCVAACGHSQASLRAARSSTYDVEFATVWNVVTEEIHRRFPDVPIEDPIKGQIRTNYIRVEMQDVDKNDPSTPSTGLTASQLAPGQTAYGQTPFLAFRMSIDVRGTMQRKGPPWAVAVDGEVAEYKPGMAQLVPIKHGQADEPPWVQSRIDATVMNIHDRLKKYAVKKEIPKSAIASKTFDTTPWANLPDREAVALIGRVHEAAVARDTKGLRPTMADDFRWSLGGEGSADTAVMLWAADPTKLRELAHALEDGCVSEEATGEVVCPKAGQTASMARFKKVGGDWKFAVFLAK